MRNFRKNNRDEDELYSLDEAFDGEPLSFWRRLRAAMRDASRREAKEGSLGASIDQWASGAWKRGSRWPLLLLALVMVLLVVLVLGLVLLAAGASRMAVAEAVLAPESVSFETVISLAVGLS